MVIFQKSDAQLADVINQLNLFELIKSTILLTLFIIDMIAKTTCLHCNYLFTSACPDVMLKMKAGTWLHYTSAELRCPSALVSGHFMAAWPGFRTSPGLWRTFSVKKCQNKLR